MDACDNHSYSIVSVKHWDLETTCCLELGKVLRPADYEDSFTYNHQGTRDRGPDV